MGCCHHYFDQIEGGADAFTIEMPTVTFGRGTLAEVGPRARRIGMRRVAVFTDAFVAGTALFERLGDSLRSASIEFDTFAEVVIEPTDRSVGDAVRFLSGAAFDGVVSLGGGSVIDTAKAAMIYAAYPASFETYFAPPVGDGAPVPGRLLPHIACPTTSGTGSEVTPLSVIRIESLDTKFALASRYMLPTEAVIDPAATTLLPARVVASSGFDLLSHAIECYTSRAYSQWPQVEDPNARPPIQGANPWSDLHAREALRLVGEYLERGVSDATDETARDNLMWAATLAGMAFGNTGTHLPHALSYGISHLGRRYQCEDYPVGDRPFIPHGISVIVNSPSVFRFTAQAAPERHLEAARCLAADTTGATPEDAGEIVAQRIIDLMRSTGIPNGIGGVGLGHDDAQALTESASRQRRAIGNSPRDTGLDDIRGIFENAVSYW